MVLYCLVYDMIVHMITIATASKVGFPCYVSLFSILFIYKNQVEREKPTCDSSTMMC